MLLKSNEGKVFHLRFSDGELAVAKVLHVDEDHEDFVYDLISSSMARDHYRDKGHESYVGKFSDLLSAELKT